MNTSNMNTSDSFYTNLMKNVGAVIGWVQAMLSSNMLVIVTVKKLEV